MNFQKENIDLLISGGIILTMNPKGEIISDGVIGIKDDKIVFVGSKKRSGQLFCSRWFRSLA